MTESHLLPAGGLVADLSKVEIANGTAVSGSCAKRLVEIGHWLSLSGSLKGTR
ncbi:MAG: hypothetical protein ACK4VP_05475 [Nitrospira sp.]